MKRFFLGLCIIFLMVPATSFADELDFSCAEKMLEETLLTCEESQLQITANCNGEEIIPSQFFYYACYWAYYEAAYYCTECYLYAYGCTSCIYWYMLAGMFCGGF